MNLCVIAAGLPILGALPMGLWGTPGQGAAANAGLAGLVFVLSLAAFWGPGSGLVQADALGLLFGALTGFVGFTTALANLAFVRAGEKMMNAGRWRLYHAMCQVLLGAVLLGLYADNLFLLWAAVEAATIAATLGVSLSRTPAALEAAWKYFMLGGAGLALALFGTLLLYLAAQPALGQGFPALSFNALSRQAAGLNGHLLNLACIFLLFGYGTKAALVPLHGWLPDAYAQGPAPLTTCLSCLTLNVPLIALLRLRHLMQANFMAGGGALAPGGFLAALGLASILLTAFSLARRRDARRFFGFSSIEHSGITAFAFGLGGVVPVFAGLLHMALHTLIKTALFQALIHAAAARGLPAPGHFGFAQLRGMVSGNARLGWLLGACVFALTGLPPSGLFVSEFLVISQTIQRAPWFSLPLGLGLLLCAIAVLRHVYGLAFAPPPRGAKTMAAGWEIELVTLHLALAFLLAFLMPVALFTIFSGIARGLQ